MRVGAFRSGAGRGRLAVLILAVSLPAFVATAEGQRANRVGTKVTISSRVPAFSGKVRSPAGRCESHRRVQLYRSAGSGKQVIGRDRSSADGRWKIPVAHLRSGAYYAKAKPRDPGGSVVCRGARSKVVVVD